VASPTNKPTETWYIHQNTKPWFNCALSNLTLYFQIWPCTFKFDLLHSNLTLHIQIWPCIFRLTLNFQIWPCNFRFDLILSDWPWEAVRGPGTIWHDFTQVYRPDSESSAWLYPRTENYAKYRGKHRYILTSCFSKANMQNLNELTLHI